MAEVTSLQTLKGYAEGQVVEFPPFAEGQPFVARICRPSMLILAKNGKIPNELLNTANNLFVNGKPDIHRDLDALSSVFDLLDVFCEACFLEPTYQELKDIGLQLTDEQLMFVFNYAQTGVRALEPFREQPKSLESLRSLQDL